MLRSLKRTVLEKNKLRSYMGGTIHKNNARYFYTHVCMAGIASCLLSLLYNNTIMALFVVAMNSAKRLQSPVSLEAKYNLMTKFWSMRCNQKWMQMRPPSFLVCPSMWRERLALLGPYWTRRWLRMKTMDRGKQTSAWIPWWHHGATMPALDCLHPDFPYVRRELLLIYLTYFCLSFPYDLQPNLILIYEARPTVCKDTH